MQRCRVFFVAMKVVIDSLMVYANRNPYGKDKGTGLYLQQPKTELKKKEKKPDLDFYDILQEEMEDLKDEYN